jgi:L-iditol 2-dehydrogenase
MVKTVQMSDNGSIEIHEQPYPELEKGAVLVKMAYSEVCGTDVHLRKGHLVQALLKK